jgi:RNA polymerase sigma-70 factor (ECF subfamily)
MEINAHPDQIVNSSPADLVARIIAGDRNAEAELVRRYSRGVSVIVGTIVEQRAAVEDLRQESFRIAIEKIRKGDLREPERLSGFICSVARNLALQYFRQPSQREVTVSEEAVELLIDSAPSPIHNLLREENGRIVRQVLSDVRPRRYQEILYRYYVAEEEKDAICADMGLSSLHFNRVLQRARDRYRELYLAVIEKQGGKIRD